MQTYLKIVVIGFLLSSSAALSQIRSGSAFLKMLPGARQQSMAEAQTAVLDEPHTLFANPGATGFIREWQWSASYTKWIADVYNASFVYGTGLRLPWSRHSRIALGVLYQGMPEFDSSNQTAAPVTSNDVVAAISLGQPLTFLSRNISIGANAKYFKSTLADYSASTFVFDGGVTARTRKFGLGNPVFPFGIFSVGAAVSHVGNDLTFDQVGTPLPQTQRAGGALYLGSHSGLQWLITADYVKVKDEDPFFAMGSEISMFRLLSLSGGYNFGNDLLRKITFGASIRLDDVGVSLGSVFPGRNNSFQMDFSTMDESDFFSRTYRGTATHFPTRPESFRFRKYANGDTVQTNDVILQWEQSYDPDLYDDVRYAVVLDQDSSKIASLLALYEQQNTDVFLSQVADDMLAVKSETIKNFLPVESLRGGDYYWIVAALDQDNHARFAKGKFGHIGHFHIPRPDIEIRDVKFEHSPYITTDDYHGELHIRLQNTGNSVAEDFAVTIVDEVVKLENTLNSVQSDSTKLLSTTLPQEEPTSNFIEQRIDTLQPGEDMEISLEWHTEWLGAHKILVVADSELKIDELSEDNNQLEKTFHTIPKGSFTTPDTATVMITSVVKTDLPLITEINFDTGSSVVPSVYLHRDLAYPPLSVLAGRLVTHPNLKVNLKGTADPNSGETDMGLAQARAFAVRDSLMALGVNDDQIIIQGGEVLPKRYVPKNPEDARWVFEERRSVIITTNSEAQRVLFAPVERIDQELLQNHVLFKSNIVGALPMVVAKLDLSSHQEDDSLSVDVMDAKDLVETVVWQPEIDRLDYWRDAFTNYTLTLTDSLGREFMTQEQHVVLTEKQVLRESRVGVPLQFAKTAPTHDMFWDHLYNKIIDELQDPNARLKFEGHACAIGPEAVNKRLSGERAKRFHNGFIQYVKNNHSVQYDLLLQRLDPPEGFGESDPLKVVMIDGADKIIGDNNSPFGRKLNRRLEVVVYRVGADKRP